MLDTNLPEFFQDLMEEINMFALDESERIRHRFTESEHKIVNTVTVKGKTYAYGNLISEFSDELEKKRVIKRYAKLSVYKALSMVLEKNLAWGALTGVRPTKLAYQQLEKGEDFRSFFINTMRVSEKKTNLISQILQVQQGIYQQNGNRQDFFVFIPFCPSRCKYCSFISADIKSARLRINEYVDALCEEIKSSIPLVKNLGSIYIGGGTPVSLDDKDLEKILCALDELKGVKEFTVEAGRPDRITRENLAILKKHGVTRICINPQTFNNKTLEKIGRKHTAEDIIEKYNLAKDDFSVNMDLIAGLDDETFEDFKYSVDRAISLNPDNITVHTLAVKRGSYLAEKTDRVCVEDIEKMIDYAYTALTEKGYRPYYLYRQKYMTGNLENVGYAKKSTECVYNVDIMEETTDIIACGAGAISKKIKKDENKIERVASPKDVATYVNKLEKTIAQKNALFLGKSE